MAWMNTLYRTYEANAAMAGVSDGGIPLTLLAHITANAQIEISVGLDGSFMGATELTKESGKTIIPITEASASRSSGIAPHALCDTLSYIARDFGDYLADEKAAKKSSDKFSKYITALDAWNNSAYATPKLNAIFSYVSGGSMTSDLIGAGILQCGEDGKLSDKKVSGKPYEAALVRFRVLGDQPEEVWLDADMFGSYTEYYMSTQSGATDVCYITGNDGVISTNHPKGIVAASYGAKLISANDTQNFVYRGRFATSEQACSISYEATQKAHSALTWIAARQGVTFGTKRTYICWNPNGGEVVDISNPFGLTNEDEPKSKTEEEYKYNLIAALNGWRGKLDDNDDIVIIALDAATTGRLSVVYYNELKSSDFYDRITEWGKTVCWYFTRYTADRKPYTEVMTPLTRDIVRCTYGTERGGMLEVDTKVMAEQTGRILHCMLDRQPVPRDIMHALAIRASNPLAYTRGNHERILSTACAMITGYYKSKGVNIKMTLDYDNTDRSYLFGRLLAVAEKMERSTYKNDEQREPNAIRLQCAFVNRPSSMWKILEEQLNPYIQRMTVGSRKFFKAIITDDIMAKFKDEDYSKMNNPLDEKYLIGYYLQLAELNKKHDDNNKEEKSNG